MGDGLSDVHVERLAAGDDAKVLDAGALSGLQLVECGHETRKAKVRGVGSGGRREGMTVYQRANKNLARAFAAQAQAGVAHLQQAGAAGL